MKNRLENWFSKFRKYLFFYKEGFFELPYAANSPQSMLSSFIKMPFVKHDPALQKMTTNNFFTRCNLFYLEVFDGLTLFVADIYFKANVNFKMVYDNNDEVTHYVLSYHLSRINLPSHDPMINGVSLANNNWSLFKPGTNITDCHFKGSNGVFFSFYFTQKWLDDFLLNNSDFDCVELKKFIDSEQPYMFWHDVAQDEANFYDKLWNEMLKPKANADFSIAVVQNEVQKFIKAFLAAANEKNVQGNLFEVDDADKTKVLKAERVLQEHLFNEFPGPEKIAKEVGLRTNKLNEQFKIAYSNTLQEYHHAMRMRYAKEAIESGAIELPDISKILNYGNIDELHHDFIDFFGVDPYLLPKRKDVFTSLRSSD